MLVGGIGVLVDGIGVLVGGSGVLVGGIGVGVGVSAGGAGVGGTRALVDGGAVGVGVISSSESPQPAAANVSSVRSAAKAHSFTARERYPGMACVNSSRWMSVLAGTVTG